MTIHVQISTVKCMQFLHLKKKNSQSVSRRKLCSANGQRLDWSGTIQCFPLPLGLAVVIYLKN